jgi:hypothetical protein
MSTRSQLRFVQRIDADSAGGHDEARQRIAQVYRHCDGYPDSVLRDLAQLKQLLDATRTERGPGYAAAQLLLLDKLGTMELYLDDEPDRSIRADAPVDLLDPANMEHLDQPMFLLGHGVENPADGIHGDEEYLYVVELPSHTAFDEPGEWTVKVSEHCGFLRWAGPTEDAFDRATWQFEGTLTVALEELLAEPA